MSRRFLFVAGIGCILGVSGIAATRALTNFAQAAEQNQSHHSSPPQVSTGRSVTGFGGSAHTNTIRSTTTKHGAKVTGPQVAATMVHPAEPVLRTAALANSSKVQQQLAAQGQTQHWHHHHHHDWLWGQYGYLPTNASSVVVGVPTGNTLTVTNNAGFGAGFGLGYGTVVLQSRAQRARNATVSPSAGCRLSVPSLILELSRCGWPASLRRWSGSPLRPRRSSIWLRCRWESRCAFFRPASIPPEPSWVRFSWSARE